MFFIECFLNRNIFDNRYFVIKDDWFFVFLSFWKFVRGYLSVFKDVLEIKFVGWGVD